jgi:GDP/UDP-N,N'-diacetylbacillosamine 2-epimerase (hydrolysing)
VSRKLAVVTGSRAEYAALRPLLRLLHKSSLLQIKLIVAGMHLLDGYGKTVDEVEADGVPVIHQVDMLLPENTLAAAAKGLGKGISCFAEVFDLLKPDMLLIEGDRIEALGAALAAAYMNIPIAHSGGGDRTRTIDNAARHAISMFAALHFVSTEDAALVLSGYGIPRDDIYVVGGLGLDTVLHMQYGDRVAVLEDLGLPPGSRYILVTLHPESESYQDSGVRMDHVLQAAAATGRHIIVTYPNSDPGSTDIIASIERFVAGNREKARRFESLGQNRYLNALRHADAVLGNSSSGLYEAPTLKVPVVNVGQRQEGRLKAANVVSCSYEVSDIQAGLQHVFTNKEFLDSLSATSNPYGQGQAAELMLGVIERRICQCPQ